jgi:predicted Zn-dependent peptidase
VTALTAGETVERLDRFPEELLAVDRDQVNDAINDHLHPEKLVMTAAGDFEG